MSLSNIKAMKSERGFTIVELLIVIVIIGILAAIVIVAYNGITQRAHTSKAQSAADTVVKKIEAYNAENGSYPTDFGTELTGSANSTKSWYVTGVTFSGTALSAAPTNESTVNYYTCSTNGGAKVDYWDYSANAVASQFTGGAKSGDTCTIVAS